jgi:hypothetical protein
MTHYFRPRELARVKRRSTELACQAIADGRLRALKIPSATGRVRFLILESEAKRWNSKPIWRKARD